MDEVALKRRKLGIIAGVICFAVLYLPLLDVIIRYYQDWEVPLKDFIMKLLIALIATLAVSIFFGYSISKRDSRLILISSLIIAVALVAIFCIYTLSRHAFN